MASRGLGGKIAPRNATLPGGAPRVQPWPKRQLAPDCDPGFRRRHGHDRRTPFNHKTLGNPVPARNTALLAAFGALAPG